MSVPQRYQPRPLEEGERKGWLAWSLDFFTDASLPQNPCLDITQSLAVPLHHATADPFLLEELHGAWRRRDLAHGVVGATGS